MAFTENAGARIYWDEKGQDAPLLLIMGLGWASNMWHGTREVLAAHYRTITFDNRGAGRSSVPPAPYSIAQMASDAAAVLDAAGVGAAHIVGASMGGMIAQEFALQYPARVRSLVLACTTPGGHNAVQPDAATLGALLTTGLSPRERAELMVPFLYDASTPRPVIDAELARLSEFYPIPEGFAAQLQAILAWQAYDRLTQISAPTLVIHGTNDRLVPAANGELIASRIPAAKLAMVPSAAHILFADQPGESHGALLDFLSAHP